MFRKIEIQITLLISIRSTSSFMKHFFCSALALWVLSISCSEKHYTDALTPEESLVRFSLDRDFRIEIFAAEPYVTDPVEMIFDETGTAYVVEMPDYPFRPKDGKGRGRIRRLTDTDGDGRIDSSTIYADSILEASSILPWKGGMIVTAAPNIFYLKDTNHDNRADTKELLFTGFFKNSAEYQVNNLRFAIDNWIYAANFGQEGNITTGAGANPSITPLSLLNGDFRFRMDDGRFEAETGRAQFGQTLDAWGRRFISENSIHIEQSIIPWRYTHRHPWLPSIEAVADISDHDQLMFQQTEAPYWRQERTKQRNEIAKEQKVNRIEYADDHFTGACGTTVYAGDLFPEEYYGNIFNCDVAGNLVHRDIISGYADSVQLVAKRGSKENEMEFLSSTDPWFRPVNLAVGPDGALYIVDMYRQHIEGPDFIPEELKKGMDFLNGNTLGRIYRITPKNPRQQRKQFPPLKDATIAELVELLSHPNQWWRLQAQKKLLERQDTSAVSLLKKLLEANTDPVAQIHALFALDGMHSLDAKMVSHAATDANPDIRETAMRLSEKFKENLSVLINGINDTSARVAFQATLSLGEFNSAEVVSALARVIVMHGEDHWFRTAVLSSDAGCSLNIFKILLEQGYFADSSKKHAADFLNGLYFVVNKRNKKEEKDSMAKMLSDNKLQKMIKQ
jgi:putative membrane-bound dehydrogenase-like protein